MTIKMMKGKRHKTPSLLFHSAAHAESPDIYVKKVYQPSQPTFTFSFSVYIGIIATDHTLH